MERRSRRDCKCREEVGEGMIGLGIGMVVVDWEWGWW